MGLSEEAKEKYRDVVDQLEELLTTLYKMPTDPMVNAHLEMAAEMVERQLGLDIVFPLHEEMEEIKKAFDREGVTSDSDDDDDDDEEDGNHSHTHIHDDESDDDEPELFIPPKNLSAAQQVDEIANPDDLGFLGKHQIKDENSPSADDLKKWFDGYSPN
jgi:hypothetical protein